ncbi:MAG: hypothetical protein ACP5D7_21645 [Limnospira sp.]
MNGTIFEGFEMVEHLWVDEMGRVRRRVQKRPATADAKMYSTRPIYNFDTADWANATVIDVEAIASEVVEDESPNWVEGVRERAPIWWQKANRWLKVAGRVLWPAIG